MIRLNYFCAIAVALFTASLACPAVADDDLVGKHITAIGGTEALGKIKSLERKVKTEFDVDFVTCKGTFRQAVVKDKKAYSAMDLGVFQQESGWNGEKAWAVDPQQGLRDIEGDDVDNLKMMAGVDPIASLKEQHGNAAFESLGEKELNDKTYNAVKIAETELIFFLDKETNLIEEMQVTANDPNLGGDYTVLATYGDFTEVDGVKLPHKTEIDIADGMMLITLTYEENTVNGELEDDLFEKPAE